MFSKPKLLILAKDKLLIIMNSKSIHNQLVLIVGNILVRINN